MSDEIRLTREDLANIRSAIRSNLLDGDEGGRLTINAVDLLNEVVEIIDIEINGDAAHVYADEAVASGLTV